MLALREASRRGTRQGGGCVVIAHRHRQGRGRVVKGTLVLAVLAVGLTAAYGQTKVPSALESASRPAPIATTATLFPPSGLIGPPTTPPATEPQPQTERVVMKWGAGGNI